MAETPHRPEPIGYSRGGRGAEIAPDGAAGLADPARRGAGRRLARGQDRPRAGPDHHDQLQDRRGPRGRQDQDQVQGRRDRAGQQSRACAGPSGGHRHRRAGQERRRRYLVEDTRFWVVRPRISGGSVSGLGTLLWGSYIGMDVGKSSKPTRAFHRPRSAACLQPRRAGPGVRPAQRAISARSTSARRSTSGACRSGRSRATSSTRTARA